MVVVIELCILIVVKIQANNVNSTSFAHSDPIIIPHFSELDQGQDSRYQEQEPKPDPKLEHQTPNSEPEHHEPKVTLHSCITKTFENCEKKHKSRHEKLPMVIVSLVAFKFVLQNCISNCWIHSIWTAQLYMQFAPCLELCYEMHVKNYPHNP